MKKNALLLSYLIFLFITLVVFIGSCLITLTDGQGALIFIFSIPAIIFLLFLSWAVGRKLVTDFGVNKRLLLASKIFSVSIALFFVFLFIPVLRSIPQAFFGFVGKTFEHFVGKTPYQYVRERNSLPQVVSRAIAKNDNKPIKFSELGLTYAWDKMCIFGPYTDNQKARSVLELDWNIEDRSEIKHSESINALVFLYQGKVNHVVDLNRGIVDFKNLDLCIERERSQFELSSEGNSRKILGLVN